MSVPNNDKYAGPWVLPVGRFANVRLTGRAGAIAPTTLVAAAPVGLYRVSLCLAITNGGTAGELTLSVISFGDGGGGSTQSLAAVLVTGTGNIAQDDFVCEAEGGVDIQYQVTATGLTAGALQYSVRAVAEQISALP